ncbi:hypothetical protein B1748_23715 [Paenibacillus sp. MY03]|uniref:hypothetical protein n=1 Tax=Paenibacillus sp. MY03 TaxID=302980 RepID=UPI000B3CBACD|nr:hypothetical protein [Paenibacillus sp. MY03]OUS73017.1 hypothetical protein B1748_23715 [Paenibacillus sp. MY03]
MNWRHLMSQVECMMLDSQVTLEEYKEIISEEKWYEHPAMATQKWWFGRGKQGLVEVTFQQIRSMWGWMGIDTEVVTGAMRYKIAETVDELIRIDEEEARHDLKVELDKAVEGAAA